MSNIRLLFHRIWATVRRRPAETDLSREINAHLQLLEDKFVTEGMTAHEARFAAKRAFGGIEQTKELQRDARSFRWLTGWTMELRLGVRMLLRYPGLTVFGGLAMALAIFVGTSVFEVIKRATDPVIPLPDGHDIVALTYWDNRENDRKPASSYDFLKWRAELTTLQDVGAFRLMERNLAAEGGVAEPVTVAQISPAAFRMTRIPPLFGRTLVEADENPGSPSVVVLGYRLWQTRFSGDPAVVGRTVRLGGNRVTVAGVMPEGFAFPVDDHFWTPLRPAELAREPGKDPLKVFGRLAPGATIAKAQAEAALVAARAAASHPDHYAQLTPQVLPYANSFLSLSLDLFVQAGIHSINAFAVLLLTVICGNVALLMLTRTATREREILVRTALGATRGRILTQLLLEALLLAALALGLGLTATNVLLKAVADTLRVGDRWPFWLDGGLSLATVGYAAALTILAAIIVGVVPGLKVMGRGMSDRLRQSSAGGGGLRMGRMWTGLIVTQIAATVLFTATAFVVHRQAEYLTSVKTVFPTSRYLSVRLAMESDSTSQEHRELFAVAIGELERRLASDSAVQGVTVAEQLPLMATTTHRAIEVSGASPADQSRFPGAGVSAVAPSLFRVFQMPVLAGRVFDSRDLNANANTVVVNNLFVERILGGRNAVGQRIRYVERTGDRQSPVKPGPWLEIIGVVRDLMPDAGAPLNLDNPAQPRLYECLNVAKGSNPLYLAVHAKSDPLSLIPTLRRIAGEVSAALQLHDILPLDHAVSGDARFWRVFANLFITGSAIVLFLSLAGIYSVTSYTVSRRTREIGVRVALGAPAARVVGSIFRGPVLQVATGVAIGCALLAAVALSRSGSGIAMARQAAIIVVYGIAVVAVCTLSCIGPALRALRVDPVEALRDDA